MSPTSNLEKILRTKGTSGAKLNVLAGNAGAKASNAGAGGKAKTKTTSEKIAENKNTAKSRAGKELPKNDFDKISDSAKEGNAFYQAVHPSVRSDKPFLEQVLDSAKEGNVFYRAVNTPEQQNEDQNDPTSASRIGISFGGSRKTPSETSLNIFTPKSEGEQLKTATGTDVPDEYNYSGSEVFGDNWAQWISIVNKSTLTDDDKSAAKEAAKAMEDIYPILRRGSYGPAETNLPNEIVSLHNLLRMRSEATSGAAASYMSVYGLDWLNDRLYRSMLEKKGILNESDMSARETTALLQSDHPIASTIGATAGTLAMALGLSGMNTGIAKSATGAIKGISKVAPWIQRGITNAISSGMTFGELGFIQGLTDTVTKSEWDESEQQKVDYYAQQGINYEPIEYSAWKQAANVVRKTAINTLGGITGSIVSTIVGYAGAFVLVETGLQTPMMEAIRLTVSGTSFAAARVASTYWLYPENERPTKEQIVQDIIIATFFSAITAASETAKITSQNKAYLENGVSQMKAKYQSTLSGKMSAAEKTQAYKEILELNKVLKGAISQNYYAGQQTAINEILHALDAADELINACMPKNAGAATPNGIPTGTQAITSATSAGMPEVVQTQPTKATEVAAQTATQAAAHAATQGVKQSALTSKLTDIGVVEETAGEIEAVYNDAMRISGLPGANRVNITKFEAAVRKAALEGKTAKATKTAEDNKALISLRTKYNAVKMADAATKRALESGNYEAHAAAVQKAMTVMQDYEDAYAAEQADSAVRSAKHNEALLKIQDGVMAAYEPMRAEVEAVYNGINAQEQTQSPIVQQAEQTNAAMQTNVPQQLDATVNQTGQQTQFERLVSDLYDTRLSNRWKTKLEKNGYEFSLMSPSPNEEGVYFSNRADDSYYALVWPKGENGDIAVAIPSYMHDGKFLGNLWDSLYNFEGDQNGSKYTITEITEPAILEKEKEGMYRLVQKGTVTKGNLTNTPDADNVGNERDLMQAMMNPLGEQAARRATQPVDVMDYMLNGGKADGEQLSNNGQRVSVQSAGRASGNGPGGTGSRQEMQGEVARASYGAGNASTLQRDDVRGREGSDAGARADRSIESAERGLDRERPQTLLRVGANWTEKNVAALTNYIKKRNAEIKKSGRDIPPLDPNDFEPVTDVDQGTADILTNLSDYSGREVYLYASKSGRTDLPGGFSDNKLDYVLYTGKSSMAFHNGHETAESVSKIRKAGYDALKECAPETLQKYIEKRNALGADLVEKSHEQLKKEFVCDMYGAMMHQWTTGDYEFETLGVSQHTEMVFKTAFRKAMEGAALEETDIDDINEELAEYGDTEFSEFPIQKIDNELESYKKEIQSRAKKYDGYESENWDSNTKVYNFVGVRVQEKPFELGEMTHKSNVWDGRGATKDVLNGVSTIDYKKLTDKQTGNYFGGNVAIIGGDVATAGDDYGELVIQDPTVLEIIKDAPNSYGVEFSEFPIEGTDNARVAEYKKRSAQKTDYNARVLQDALSLYRNGYTPAQYWKMNPQEYDAAVGKQLRSILMRNGKGSGGQLPQEEVDALTKHALKFPQYGNPRLTVMTPYRIVEDLGRTRNENKLVPKKTEYAGAPWAAMTVKQRLESLGRTRNENTAENRAANYEDGVRIRDALVGFADQMNGESAIYERDERDKVMKAFGKGTKRESALIDLLGQEYITEEDAKSAIFDRKHMIVPSENALYVFGSTSLGLMSDRQQTILFDQKYRDAIYKKSVELQKSLFNAKTESDYKRAIEKFMDSVKAIPYVTMEGESSLVIKGRTANIYLPDGTLYATVENGKNADMKVVNDTTAALRDYYDRAYNDQNIVLVENGYPAMRMINKYFPHHMPETGSLKGFRRFITSEDLPTWINGTTATRKPGRPYTSHILERMGIFTNFDAIENFNTYLPSAADLIHMTPVIQRIRQFEREIRSISKNASEAGTPGARSKNSALASYLVEYGNQFANKKPLIDRGAESMFGRKYYKLQDKVTGMFGASAVMMNFSVAMSNLIAGAEAFATLDKKLFAKNMFIATAQGLKIATENISWIPGEYDKFADDIPFLASRRNKLQAILTNEQHWKKFRRGTDAVASALFDIFDYFSTEAVARTEYDMLMRKGYTKEAARMETSAYCTKVFANRTTGMMPLAFRPRALKPFLQFLLEPTNQMGHLRDMRWESRKESVDNIRKMIGDGTNPEDVEEEIKKTIASEGWRSLAKMLVYMVAMSLYGILPRYTKRRDQTFNPAGLVWDFYNDLGEVGFKQALQNAGLTILDQSVLGGFKGGGRVPVGGAFENIGEAYETIVDEDATAGQKWGKVGEALAGFAPAGGQISKTVRGVVANQRGGSYTASGKLRYPVTEDDYWRTFFFGPSAAQPYGFDYQTDTLSAKKTAQYEALVEKGFDPMDVYYMMVGYDGSTNATKALSILTADSGGADGSMARNVIDSITGNKKKPDGKPDFTGKNVDVIAEVLGLSYDPKEDGSLEKWAKKEAADYKKRAEKDGITADEQAKIDRIDEMMAILLGMK